jgi:hypothetical protein
MSAEQPQEKATSRPRRAMARVQRRPAEAAGATGSLAGVLIALAAGDRVAIATAVAGLIPAVWTFCRSNGGVVGVVRKVLFGDSGGASSGAAAAATEVA